MVSKMSLFRIPLRESGKRWICEYSDLCFLSLTDKMLSKFKIYPTHLLTSGHEGVIWSFQCVREGITGWIDKIIIDCRRPDTSRPLGWCAACGVEALAEDCEGYRRIRERCPASRRRLLQRHVIQLLVFS